MIRITYILLFTLVLPLFTKAQINHVPNGNFNYYTQCPSAFSQLTNLCIGWSSFFPGGTPDYYSYCGTGYASVPSTILGYQHPASGIGYAGIVSHLPGSSTKEIITSNIIPLSIGSTYEVSLSVSLANTSQYAADDITVYFFNNIYQQSFAQFIPQISFQDSGVINDTLNWVRLTGYFIADSAYSNIAIGGFLHDSVVNIDTLSYGTRPYAYYFIDSVVVKPTNSIISINGYSDTELCVNDTLSIYFAPKYPLGTLNYITVQLSDASGSFSNPIDIGGKFTHTTDTISVHINDSLAVSSEYKIRLITSLPADTAYDTITTFSIGNIDSVNIQLASNSPICSGQALNFSNTATDTAINFLWNGPNGFYSFSKNPTIYNASLLNMGNYYVSSTFYGCEQKDTLNVIINPSPNKPVASGNTPICEYDSLHLSSSSSTVGVTYSWTGPNGFTSSTNDTSIGDIGLVNGGSYIVTATKDGCSSYDTVSIIVNDAPDTVSISYTSPCSGDTLKIFADTLSNVSYSWKGPNNFTANTQNILIPNTTVNNSGWYVMTVSNTNCSYRDSVLAIVNQTPITPTITYNNPICVGESLSLSALGNSTSTYNWNGANNFSTTGKAVTRSNVQLADSGIYTVTASQNGCTASSSVNISINPTPFANIYVTPADSICSGEVVSFTALPSNTGANPQYSWYVNAQQQSFTGQQFYPTSLNNNDVIYCEMTDNTKCSSPYTDQSNTITMTVLPWLAPSVSITSNPAGLLQPWQYVTFTAHPINAGTSPQYQWKRNGQDVVGATGSTWSANNLNDNDSISVELVSDYKCPNPINAASNGIVVSVAVSVNDVAALNNISLIPNPNNGQFSLKGNINNNGKVQITIINTLGQIVHRAETLVTDQTINEQINLNGIASGLYLLRLDINGQRANIKFRVE